VSRCFFRFQVAITLLLLSTAGVALGQSGVPVRVFVNGAQVRFPDQRPLIVDGRTLVPLRGVFEAMGATVDWDARALRATVQWRGNQAAVFIGTRTAWVNGRQRTLDVAPRLIGGRTMVPLRFVAESFGLEVNWVDRYNAVVIGSWPAMPVMVSYGDPDLEMPCTIRVQMNPMGKGEPLLDGPLNVMEVDMAEYVADVLAHEMGDFEENGKPHYFTEEPLKAGAMAILMYAWYHAWHPRNAAYDLDNSQNSQVYLLGLSKRKDSRYRDAVRAVWSQFMVRSDTEVVFAPEYRAGAYKEMGSGGEKLYQRSALYLSDKYGYSWERILRYYYPKAMIKQHPVPCPGLD